MGTATEDYLKWARDSGNSSPNKMPEWEWTRIYVDRMKISSLNSYVKPGKKRRILDFARKFDLELMFAKLPLQNVISDRNIEELIDEIAHTGGFESVGQVVSRLLKESSSPRTGHKGELALVEASIPIAEGFTIHRPDGRTIPFPNRGAYLAYRRPFDKLPLFDGIYHSALLFEIIDVESYDILKIFLKESEDSDPAMLLDAWDNSHARVIGFLSTCPPYLSRVRTQGIRTQERKQEKHYLSYGLFPIAVDATPLENLDMAQRMKGWRTM